MPSEKSHSQKLPITPELPSSHPRLDPPSPSSPTKPGSLIDKQHLSAGGSPSIGLGLNQEVRKAHNGILLARSNPCSSTPTINSKPFTNPFPTPPDSPRDTRSPAQREGDSTPEKDSCSGPPAIRTITSEPANSASNPSEVHLNDDSDDSDDSGQGHLEELRSGSSTTPIGRLFRPLANILALPKRRSRTSREVRKAQRSRVDDAFRLVKRFSNGQYIGPQPRSRTLSQTEYHDLLDRIEAETAINEYICEGLRFGYSAVERCFTIHMITPLHETFGRILNGEIHDRLKNIALKTDDPVIKRIIAGLDPGGSLQLRPSHGQYEGLRPDESFCFASGAPELVIEVGWTQSKGDVEKKAGHYFKDFNDEIRTVIGINLNNMYKEQEDARKKWLNDKMKYEKGTLQLEPEPLEFPVPEAAAKSADFSVWRAGKRAVKNRLFQTSYEKHKAGAKLILYLNDFIRPADIDKICEEEGRRAQDIRWPRVELPSEMLCGMVKRGVNRYHDTYLKDANRALEKRKAEWVKKEEAAAEAARRRQVAELSSVPGTLGRLRDRTKILKPQWLRSPKL